MNKTSGIKPKKEKVIEKKKCSVFTACLQFSDLLKEFDSAYVPYIICFIQTCYKIRLHRIPRAQQNKAGGEVSFSAKINTSAEIAGTRKELFSICSK